MSTNSQGIDARAYLAGWLQGLTGMYTSDINAIPEDKWTATFGGCTRPASEISADAISLMEWTTNAMKGQVESDYMGHMDKVKEACATRAGTVERLGTAAQAFTAALNSCSDQDLQKMVTPPWQMESPLFGIAQVAVSHLWYHDGQLNYIQCLLGDDKVHWMGE
ncbi:MAG: hypothetical protein KIT11_04390 [Fimbriimonadaceae bacterium]|nr:hypothetical protein [Fimbriimonadaceae bacterium]QYK56866.1 MAG: hypothetical protein KF733_05135 [Fimbriimonadaceae bacterium]